MPELLKFLLTSYGSILYVFIMHMICPSPAACYVPYWQLKPYDVPSIPLGSPIVRDEIGFG